MPNNPGTDLLNSLDFYKYSRTAMMKHAAACQKITAVARQWTV